ncbi:MAG: two-CW domain-containing protein [Nitrospirota bacterium]
MRITNCWEFKRCGREAGDNKVKELGMCPVSTEQRLDGVHDGECAGRACWILAGTLCAVPCRVHSQ